MNRIGVICSIAFCVLFNLQISSSSTIVSRSDSGELDFLQKSGVDITKIILKKLENNETNYIFSPFGYTVILGLLSEGAENTTKQELTKILHYPDDVNLVRQTYKQTLERFQDKASSNPEFKNYFYVYRNFSVQDSYKKILLENYFTEVKSVERPSYDEDEISTDEPTTNAFEPEPSSTTSSPQPEKKTRRERIKRLVKRFLGIDLENSSKSEVSGLSANRLYTGNVTQHLSRMIVFNGLYFKGVWKTPFQYKQGNDSFYLQNGEKIATKMMFTVGKFNVGQLPELNSSVFFIPYKGERYSFVLIVPNEKDGLPKVLQNFDNVNLSEISSKLEQRHVQISMPSFEFKTISYLKKSLNELGAYKIFTSDANFNSISKDSGLFVDDIVQLVTINIDNDAATPNFLTASSVQTRTVTEKFTIDRPFLFFVQDHKDNITIASGILGDPTTDRE
ncbi:serpin B4-like [Planococcus citri]|uniref:serpin B4-like n=1 Tax=Planococcus citri TaxID=170843 RepID=UPI0031F898FD